MFLMDLKTVYMIMFLLQIKKMSIIWPAVGAVALPNIGGFLSGYFVGRENYTTWYDVSLSSVQ